MEYFYYHDPFTFLTFPLIFITNLQLSTIQLNHPKNSLRMVRNEIERSKINENFSTFSILSSHDLHELRLDLAYSTLRELSCAGPST